MLRRSFLASAASAAPALLSAKTKRPNVLVILTDDQGYGDLSLHGNPVLKTPHMDRIGREGVQFTQFHVSPVCSPTRSSFMTGRYNYRTRVVDTYIGRSLMDPGEVTVARMLGGAGYRTGIFGKWHLGDNYPLRATDHGFQEALLLHGGGLAQPADAPGSKGYFDPILWHNNQPVRTKGYCTDVITAAAIRFMEDNRRHPFFTYVAVNAPHDPLLVEDRYVKPYRDAGVPENTAKVYGMLANLDENVGKLLDSLTNLGLERDTMVIFFTDNGPYGARYNAGMRGAKGTVYEGGIRVPCFLRWPGVVKPGSTTDRLAAHIDLTPTILDACGVRKPDSVKFDGRSLLPLARGQNANWPDRTLFFQWHRGDEPQPFRDCAARNQRWKLVNGKALYDLESDPAEAKDVAADHPDIVAGLRAAYETWFRDVSSTRGFAPPRIVVGTEHENPTLLTRQDWRHPGEGWGTLGHWEIEVAADGKYQFRLLFPPQAPTGEAEILLDGKPAAPVVPIPDQTAEITIGPLPLTKGKISLEPRLHFGAQTIGPEYCELRRI